MVSSLTLTVGRAIRTYCLSIPEGDDGTQPLPLVMVLHGRGGSGAIADERYGFTELSQRERFVVCYPEALHDFQQQTAWNAVFYMGQRGDDLAFLEALFQHLKTTVNIDPKRIYLCGHSSGGMMTYRFAAERGVELAAIGVVAGSIGSTFGLIRKIRIPKPAMPLSLIAIHGKSDPVVPYDWRATTIKLHLSHPLLRFVSAPESVRLFVDVNGITNPPEREESFDGNIVRETFSGGIGGTEVVFYSVGDGNHKWPGGNYGTEDDASRSGPANQQIHSATLLWEFFKKHPRT